MVYIYQFPYELNRTTQHETKMKEEEEDEKKRLQIYTRKQDEQPNIYLNCTQLFKSFHKFRKSFSKC